MKIAIGSDHGGFNLKHLLVEELEERGITIEDHGCFGTESADYPDHAAAVQQTSLKDEQIKVSLSVNPVLA